jgi:hypothetical protein
MQHILSDYEWASPSVIISGPGVNPTTSEFTTMYSVSVVVPRLASFPKYVEENIFVSKTH